MTTPLDRLQGWLAQQSTAGGDLRFVLVLGTYVIAVFLACAVLAVPLSLLLDGGLR